MLARFSDGLIQDIRRAFIYLRAFCW